MSPAFAAEQDSLSLLKAAEDAFAKGDIPSAASLSNLAVLKYRVDATCFPPAGRPAALDDFMLREAALNDKLRAKTLGDPDVMAREVRDAEAWQPIITDDYQPGWQTSQRCQDYVGLAARFKTQMLPFMQRAAALLKFPEYRRAFLAFSDVMQDYDRPPPDDAYAPARLASMTEAVHTMQGIETTQGTPYFGQIAAMTMATARPVAFHIIASGKAQEPISYAGSADQVPSNNMIIHDQPSLARLWSAIYGKGPAAPPVPVVDFDKQIVVQVLDHGRSPALSGMFISRIEAGDKPPSLMVYVRVPVWSETCFAGQTRMVYPYAVAVLDRPADLPTATGGDVQNFPAPGCPAR